jgi:hypothetical protein
MRRAATGFAQQSTKWRGGSARRGPRREMPGPNTESELMIGEECHRLMDSYYCPADRDPPGDPEMG